MTHQPRPFEFYLISLIVAFCSLIYEFVIAQTLAAVMGGTLLCYALVIGSFTLTMGLGALHVEYLTRSASQAISYSWRHFLHVEIMLTLLGALGPWWVLWLDPVQWSIEVYWPVQILAFLPSLIIGWYTGKELPLLMNLATDSSRSLRVMAFDYLGMFVASLSFPLFLLPQLGVWGTSLLTALLNAAAAAWVLWRSRAPAYWSWLQTGFVVLLLFAWSQQQRLEIFATNWFSRV